MSRDVAHIIGRILVPPAVIGVVGLLRRFLPARTTSPQTQLDPNGDVEDFSSANVAVYAGMILVGIVFAFSVHWLFVAGNHYFAKADGQAAFQFFPSGAIWWFFPGFGSLCLSWEITLFLWSLFSDPNTVSRFIDWTNERAGYDSTRALRWMTVVIAVPIAIATFLAIPMHSTLREDYIMVGHYATLAEQNLPYAQARRVVLVDGVPNSSGKFSARAGMIVDFRDGTRWSSSANGGFRSEVGQGVAEFLQQKTGLPLEHVETENDISAQMP